MKDFKALPSKNLSRHHKEVQKLKFKLFFSLRPGLGREGLNILEVGVAK